MNSDNLQKYQRRFWSYVHIAGEDDCWNWIGGRANGYGIFRIGKRSIGSHRFSYLMANGNIPDDLLVMHSCDNPSCVNPKHLRAGTQTENISDMYKRNRAVDNSGENSAHAKVTEKEVIEIREKYYKDNITQSQLSKMYNLSQPSVNEIIHRRTWKHI